MPNPSTNAVHSFSSLSTPSIDTYTLVSLAEKLEETAKILLTACQPQEGKDNSGPEKTTETKDRSTKSFEIRAYEIPNFTLQDEQDLLKKSNSEDLHEVLNKIYGHIYCIVTLMSQYPAEKDMDGVLVNEIADVLSIPLEWLEQLCCTFVGFRLVQRMKAE